jgi:hypothetical protein
LGTAAVVPATAAAAAAAISSESSGEPGKSTGMSPQAAAFAAASAAKRSCDLLRATFGQVGEGKSREKKDKARILIQQTVLHCALLCTTACRAKNHATYRAWTARQNREWWKQAKLEHSLGLKPTTPFAEAAAMEAEEHVSENSGQCRPTISEIAEIEMGLFEQVLLPFLVPLFDLFPPTRFLASPLADNHAMITAEKRKELSTEYRNAERRFNAANEVTERLIGVARAPSNRRASTFRGDKEVESKESDSPRVSSETGKDDKNDSGASVSNSKDTKRPSLKKTSSVRSGSSGSQETNKDNNESKSVAIGSIKRSAAATKWAAGLRWATERDKDKDKDENEKKEEEARSFGWPKMSDMRASAMAAASRAKSKQLAAQKARLHLEARAEAFAETLSPYVKKEK